MFEVDRGKAKEKRPDMVRTTAGLVRPNPLIYLTTPSYGHGLSNQWEAHSQR
jgi:hypothetical protein